MTQEPIFLLRDAVEKLHEYVIDAFGGLPGLRDEGGLESALHQPEASFAGEYLYSYLWGMAVAYVVGIAMNHPFADGNKRTAAAALGTFLGVNGYDLVCSQEDLEGAILGLVTRQFSRQDFEMWLQDVCILQELRG